MINVSPKRCKQCGHIDTEFLQPAKIDAMAVVDSRGEFVDWKYINFENPNFEEDVFLCAKCQSNELEDIEEDVEQYI